jgi:hypothetical protein
MVISEAWPPSDTGGYISCFVLSVFGCIGQSTDIHGPGKPEHKALANLESSFEEREDRIIGRRTEPFIDSPNITTYAEVTKENPEATKMVNDAVKKAKSNSMMHLSPAERDDFLDRKLVVSKNKINQRTKERCQTPLPCSSSQTVPALGKGKRSQRSRVSPIIIGKQTKRSDKSRSFRSAASLLSGNNKSRSEINQQAPSLLLTAIGEDILLATTKQPRWKKKSKKFKPDPF